MTTRQFYGIDLFKIIAAYLILLLHVSVFPSESFWYDALRQVVTIVAVPFFFAASGFVLSYKLKGDFPSAIKNNYKKYVIWSVIYFPIVLFGWLLNSASLSHDFLYYVRDFFLEGSYLTIWFLNALVFALFIEWLLLKRFSSTTCFLISVPCFFVACLLSSYHELLVGTLNMEKVSSVYYTVFSSTKNGLLFGFPFVSLGVMVADMKFEARKPYFWAIGMGGCFLALIGEVILRNRFFSNNRSVDFAVMLIPFSFCALSFAKSIQLKERKIYLYLRSLSVLLFLTQRIFIFGFDILDKILFLSIKREIFTVIPVVHFVFVAGSTTLFSMLLLYLSKKYSWLKKLY